MAGVRFSGKKRCREYNPLVKEVKRLKRNAFFAREEKYYALEDARRYLKERDDAREDVRRYLEERDDAREDFDILHQQYGVMTKQRDDARKELDETRRERDEALQKLEETPKGKNTSKVYSQFETVIHKHDETIRGLEETIHSLEATICELKNPRKQGKKKTNRRRDEDISEEKKKNREHNVLLARRYFSFYVSNTPEIFNIKRYKNVSVPPFGSFYKFIYDNLIQDKPSYRGRGGWSCFICEFINCMKKDTRTSSFIQRMESFFYANVLC